MHYALFKTKQKQLTPHIQAEKRGLKDTKQEEFEIVPLGEVFKDMVLELDICKTKRFSAVYDQTTSELSDANSVRSSRASSSGWSARRRLDSGAVVLIVHEVSLQFLK
jgi:hypothetical protein